MLRIIKVSINQTRIYDEFPYPVPTAIGRDYDHAVGAWFCILLHILASLIIVTTILLFGIKSIFILLLHLIFVIKELHEKVGSLSHLLNMISQLTPISFGSSRYLSFG